MDTGNTRTGDTDRDHASGASEPAELKRQWRERRERAIAVLKEHGIWQRLLDGKHTLRYIYSGIMEIDYLKLDEAAGALSITETTHDAVDLPYSAFVLTPGTEAVGPVVLDQWFEEGGEVYQALEVLMVWW